jgi:hypothetical protein
MQGVRKIFGPKKDKLSGQFRILYYKKLCDLHRSCRIVRIVKPRQLQWAGHVDRMGERSNA